MRIRELKKSFGANRVLDGVDLDVHKGEVVVVIGPSGSGKTTLLRCINLLETYDEGSIQVDGVEVGFRDGGGGAGSIGSDRELARIRADIGMVFQLFNLFPHLTARENVMLGLRKVRGLIGGRRQADRGAVAQLASGWATSSTACRASSPAASSSGWASRAPWRWIPRCCSSTRSPRPSIPSWSARC